MSIRDRATWLPPIIKQGAPIVYLNTRSYKFNANAIQAPSLNKFRDGAQGAGNSIIFGMGSAEEQTEGWKSHFVATFDAYQRTWQETFGWRRPTWIDLKQIPNTADHRQHVMCQEIRSELVLPTLLERWPDRLLNLCFDDQTRMGLFISFILSLIHI